MSRKIKSRIAELRQKAGLTQAQLAVYIGVSPNTIQNWEKDRGLDQLEKYLKLCDLFGLKAVEDLIEYVEVPEGEEAKPKGFSREELRRFRQRWGTAANKKNGSANNSDNGSPNKPKQPIGGRK